MKNFQKTALAILSLTLLAACSEPKARKPISQTSNPFIKQSIARNKKLIKGEEGQIDSIIRGNSKVQYLASLKGYWYAYENRNEKDTIKPKKGDIAYFDYEIKDLQGNVIYSDVELGPQTYRIDRENILMGLRDGIKLMHKKEKVTFLFPSHLGFGFRGDTKKVAPNTPLMVTVTLNDFKKETQAETAPKKDSITK